MYINRIGENPYIGYRRMNENSRRRDYSSTFHFWSENKTEFSSGTKLLFHIFIENYIKNKKPNETEKKKKIIFIQGSSIVPQFNSRRLVLDNLDHLNSLALVKVIFIKERTTPIH